MSATSPSTDLSQYHSPIARKQPRAASAGIQLSRECNSTLSERGLFDHQKHGIEFALNAARSALFYDTGLGKTAMALEWGDEIVRETKKPVLMLSPLAVAPQHILEARRLEIDALIARDGSEVIGKRIYVTNYDRVNKFDASKFGGVILDESSIIKSFSGVTTKHLIATFAETPFRLCCTATPAPNDHTELGQHAEFLGIMRRADMLPRWFVHDSADTGVWRLKGHAVRPFWDWISSWARCVGKPSDLGFSDDGFELPPLNIVDHVITADRSDMAGEEKSGQMRLLRLPDTSATSIHREKRLTAEGRTAEVARIISAEPDEAWIIWVDTDYEADAVHAALPGIVEVRGSQKIDLKEHRLNEFSQGRVRWMMSKPSIAGYGLNWQHCARMVFAGLSFSYENFYQAVRRCWRFRQTRQVDAHVVMADTEAAIWSVVSRKAEDHDVMKDEMREAMRRAVGRAKGVLTYHPTESVKVPAFMGGQDAG